MDMLKSIWPYIKSLGYWGFVVAVFLVSDIFGIVQSYISSESGNFLLPVWAWWLILALILLVSPFLAFHKLRLEIVNKDKNIAELRNNVTELENKKPSISVVPVLLQDLWCLEVTNNGEKGIFTAEVSVFDNKADEIAAKYKLEPLGEQYNALWGKTNTDKSEIWNGQKDIIKLAAVGYTNKEKYIEVRAYDTVSKHPYLIKHVEFERFRRGTFQLFMQVLISSEPSLREGTSTREYCISLHDIIESTEPRQLTSVPHKYMFGDDEENKIF